VITQGVPETKDEERMTVVELPHGFYPITARYGFMEEPNIPLVLQWAREFGVKSKPGDTSYFLGRERIDIVT
jgi:KUP system potassium uptake protein